MLHTIGRTVLAQLQNLLHGFLQDGTSPFGSVLTVQEILDLIRQECVETRERLFTPLVTLCTFLSQIHSDAPSCRAAVAAVRPPHRASRGIPRQNLAVT